ncbi:MAG: hypothetical protein IJX74_05260 [Clostridia bacterium]|nr:hypothetical protein [Clostridia bacterium]
MNDAQTSALQYLVIIAEQKKKNKFLTLLSEHGARGIETVYGHGSMSPSAIAAAFGFEAEQSKVLISCLVKSENARELINVLYTDYNFNKPNTGIAFCIPVEGLAF